MSRQVLLVVAPRGFADEEYLAPRAAFDAAGFKVVVASTVVGPVRGAQGTWVVSERTIATVRAADFDAVVFIGGPGATALIESRAARRLALEAVERGKVLGAICMAPVVAAAAGVLRGVRATCWPEARPALAAGGAVVVEEPVVTSGRVVTADGPSSAAAFGRAIVAAMR